MFTGKATKDPSKVWREIMRAGGEVGSVKLNAAVTIDKEQAGTDGVKYVHLVSPVTGWGVASHFQYSASSDTGGGTVNQEFVLHVLVDAQGNRTERRFDLVK